MKPLNIEKSFLKDLAINLPSILQPSISGSQSLKIKSKKAREIVFENESKYNNIKKQLKTKNGELYNGKLETSQSFCHLINGTYKFPSGEIYKGPFNKNNLFSEDGLFTFKDGATLQCKFKDGYPNGDGIYKSKNDDFTITTNFVFDKNYNKKYFCDGKTIIIIKKNNQINFHFVGEFKNKKVEGETIIKKLMDDLRLPDIRAQFKNGKLNGKLEIQYLNTGKLFSFIGDYKYGFRDGNFKIIDKLNNLNINKEFHYLKFSCEKLEKMMLKNILNLKKINFKKFLEIYKTRKRYINLFNSFVKKLIIIIRKKRYKELIKVMRESGIIAFNKRYNTKLTGKEKSIHLNNLPLSLEGLKLFCQCRFFNLEDLALLKCKLKDLSPLNIARFEELAILSLGNNEIKSINFINEVKFTKLKNILLGGNFINNLSPLERYSSENLKVLFLLENKIKDISPLTKMNTPNLEELYLGNEIIDISPLSECNLPSLKQISFDKNKIENISVLENCKFPNLEYIVLSNNSIINATPITKNNFPKLQKITLRNNCIKNFKIFLKIKKLKKLDISGNKFTLNKGENKILLDELNKNIDEVIS